jgi:hypothetical protein
LLDERWDFLAAAHEPASPLLTAAWLRELIPLAPEEPILIALERGGELRGAGVFGLRRPVRGGPLQATWLWSIGSFSNDLLVRPDDPSVGIEILDALFEVAPVVQLEVFQGSFAEAALHARAPWCASISTSDGWRLRLPAARLEYAAKRVGKQVRHTERAGIRIEIRIEREPLEVARGLERLFRLHREHWPPGHEARDYVSGNRSARTIIRRGTKALAEAHRAVLVEVRENGLPVHCRLAFTLGRSAIDYISGTRVGALRGPAHAGILALAQALREDGLETLDLGLGLGYAGSPKARLGPDLVPSSALLAARTHLLQRAITGPRALWRGTRRLRRTTPAA